MSNKNKEAFEQMRRLTIDAKKMPRETRGYFQSFKRLGSSFKDTQ